MTGEQAIVGAVTVAVIFILVIGVALIMTREVGDDDLDDDF